MISPRVDAAASNGPVSPGAKSAWNRISDSCREFAPTTTSFGGAGMTSKNTSNFAPVSGIWTAMIASQAFTEASRWLIGQMPQMRAVMAGIS